MKKAKKLAALLMAGTLAFASAPAALAAGSSGFSDVDPSAWYAEAAAYCRSSGLMSGTGTGMFSPETTMTRAMLVAVLHRLDGSPAATAPAAFSDVKDGEWYSGAVAWAAGKGIVSGYSDGRFGVTDPITREQAVAILWRYAGQPASTGAEETAASPYAREALRWARQSGLLDNMGGSDFTPGGQASRAQLAVILMNYSREPGTLSVMSGIDIMCEPSGIASTGGGQLIVTDTYHKMVWLVRSTVSEAYAGGETVADPYGRPLGGYNDAGLLQSYFRYPWAVAPFLDGWAVSDSENNVVRVISGTITQTVNATTKEPLRVTDLGVAFDKPTGLAADEEGNLYVSDTGSGAIRKITEDGVVTTVASRLSTPTGLCWKDGALYAAETGANRIVRIAGGTVTTVAGSGAAGLADGPAAQASFSAPKGVAVGDDGAVYVADTNNSAVRKVLNGTVTTIAVQDRSQAAAGLTSPVGLLVQGGTLYICDNFSRKIFTLRL